MAAGARRGWTRGRCLAAGVALAAAASGASAIAGVASGSGRVGRASPGAVHVVAAESEYGDVVAAIGGRHVQVASVMSNPSTDPHTYEASVSVAREVASARLVVQNGAGYDDFIDRVEAASPGRRRTVIDVQHLLGLPSSTRNPHLWYSPATMPVVARAVAQALSRLDPAHVAAFKANLRRFDASLAPWHAAIAELRSRFAGAPVAVTEPVADGLVSAAGLRVRTPWAFQADVMNGVDPAPQALEAEQRLVARHEVKVLLYNHQVTDPLTTSLLALARRDRVPVVAVYETMPAPGFHYGSWMLAETKAIEAALASHRSTTDL